MLNNIDEKTDEKFNDFEDTEYQIEKDELEGDDIEEFDILSNRIISFIGNYSLRQYRENMDNKLFIKPHFQRNSVWNRSMESKLIESFLGSYPVPPLFLYLNLDQSYLIIDGFQRLTTIQKYLNNDFALNIPNKAFKGKKYRDLPEEAKRKLDNTFLNCYIVQSISPTDKTILYSIFERLNTGGKRLNTMETRRALGYGNLLKSLEKLNKNADWRLILNKPKVDNRFLDLELLLRLYALSTTFFGDEGNRLSYTNRLGKVVSYNSMKTYLNDFLTDNCDESIDGFSENFKKCCNLVVSELSDNPFSYKSSIKYNYTILDSLMTAMLLNKGNFNNLKRNVIAFKKAPDPHKGNDSFYFDNKSGTLSKQRVVERIELAITYLEK